MRPSRAGRARAWALVLPTAALLLAACGGSTGGTGRRPAPRPAGEPTVRDPLAAPWIVRRTGAPVTQTVHVAAIIESRIDTMVTVDTVQSQLTARWSLPSSGYPRRFIGTVTDYRLSRAMGDSLQVPDGLSLPVSFVAVQPAPESQPGFTTPDERACGDAHAVIVQGVRDLWLSLPDTIDAAMRWADSTSYVTCRDSIPLTATVHREFRVTGAMARDGAVIVTVERRTRTRLEGSGVQLGDSVTVEGAGTGAAMFEVSLATGAAVFASGESEFRLLLRGSRRTQDIIQRSRVSLLDQ